MGIGGCHRQGARRHQTRDAPSGAPANIPALVHESWSVVFERTGKIFERADLELVLPKLARDSIEDILADVGRGGLPADDVLKAIYPDYREDRQVAEKKAREDGWFGPENRCRIDLQNSRFSGQIA